ncbi:MAG: exodeoxyribonuclease VII large subunit, partial [Planctomycetota bacterium]
MTDEPRVYTVSELQAHVRDFLESEVGRVWVEGEISNFKRHHSGHLYFALRDADARLDAVMWRSTARRLKFEPEEGLAVRARGNLTVYPPQGRYQMVVAALEPVGAGPLQVRFEQLRRKLAEEGLFDAEHKKELPAFPRRVALITSPTGAAVRDLISVALRRWPPLELAVVPVKVQGEGAAEEIAAGIREADGRGFDVLVIGRGGGSLEDLWAFNEEVVARAVFAAQTPVVSAVGHEVDVSISDL